MAGNYVIFKYCIFVLFPSGCPASLLSVPKMDSGKERDPSGGEPVLLCMGRTVVRADYAGVDRDELYSGAFGGSLQGAANCKILSCSYGCLEYRIIVCL